jgi:vanillate O-demethylase monooxygenase subunit
MRFDGTGKCVEVPGQAFIPPGAAVRTFPTVEKYGWI